MIKKKGFFQKDMKKFACLLLTLLLLIGTLSGCQKSADPMAKSGFRELTIDSKGRVNAVVSLDLLTVQAHAGETVALYELAPDEDISVISSREPLDEADVSSTLEFRFPLEENGKTRLYSSFVVAFEDGTLLSTEGYYIQDPESLAVDTRAFPWASSPKGLSVDDADDAFSLGAMHAMYEVSLSDLISGSDSFTFHGISYPISNVILTQLDTKILHADTLGMQVSLTLHADTAATHAAYTALIDHIVSRYTQNGHCAITAIFLQISDATNAATFCRTTALALRSRVANGRVYIAPTATALDDTKVFFSTLQAQLLTGGELQWGAAIAPQCHTVSAATDAVLEDTALTVSNLSDVSSFLRATQDGAPTWLAICGLSFDADNEDGQAASYAHAYRQSILANADLVFYGSHVDDRTGLRDENGDAHRILSLFATIDMGLSAADRRLCEELIDKWNPDTKNLISRLSVSGVANAGTIGLEETPLFDFTTGETYGFVGIGAMDAPKSNHSVTWDAPVLFTWVDPLYGERGGICKLLEDAAVLENASATSIRLLCQVPEATSCTAHLTLEGTTEEGERLTYQSDVTIENGVWQTVTFQIGNFIADADLSKPVSMSLTTSSDSEADEAYVLWVNRIEVRRPTQGVYAYLPSVLVVGCLAVSFLAVFLIYRKTRSRRIRQK